MNTHTLLCQIPGFVDQWVYSGRAGDIIMRPQQAESDNIEHKKSDTRSKVVSSVRD